MTKSEQSIKLSDDSFELNEQIELAQKYSNEVSINYIFFGKVLSELELSCQSYPGTNFEKILEYRIGISLRKAKYLISIYSVITKLGIPPEKCAGIGWSKLKELMPGRGRKIHITKDNWQDLLEKVRGMSLKEVIELVRPEKESLESIKMILSIPSLEHKDLVDTAVKKASMQTGSSSYGFNLCHVCQNFLMNT